jgi:drug/metabolite transporter (DMT)-like permease
MGEGLRAAPALALVFNAAVWGLSWWPFRALQSHGLHPLWATALTYLVSMACLLAVKPQAWRRFGDPRLWLLAAAAGMTNVGFNWAVTVGDVVRVVLLFYLMPAWTVLLAWLMLGERPTRMSLLRLVLALAGVATVLQGAGDDWPLPNSLPDALAIAGGFSFSLTNILLRKLQDVPPPSRVLAMFGGGTLLAGASAATGAALGALPAIPGLPPAAWAIGCALALAFLLGNLALQFGASRLPAHATALVMLTEVLFASGSAALLGAGELTPRVLTGAAMILGTAAWAAWPARRAGAQSPA